MQNITDWRSVVIISRSLSSVSGGNVLQQCERDTGVPRVSEGKLSGADRSVDVRAVSAWSNHA